MKIVTVFGTRPEIIRLALVIRRLDGHCQQLLVHTGQNYDPALSDIFFRDLGVRAPDVHLGIQAGHFAAQAGEIIARTGELLARERPDRVLILGDTNSGLAAYAAARLGIPVYHMEAGNRCYDNRVPEEVNRRVIDHTSTVLLPYTQRSAENLVREGIERHRIFITGNPIGEVLEAFATPIEESPAHVRLGLAACQYFLCTLHRAENVDQPERLAGLLQGLSQVADTYAQPLIVSVHPRTADKLAKFGLSPESGRVRLLPPMGFFDFVALEKRARCVLSDSGTVQEECCLFRTPNVTLRDVTERPETVECGSNILSGGAPADILRATQVALAHPPAWTPPAEYTARDVSWTVARLLLGYRHAERAS